MSALGRKRKVISTGVTISSYRNLGQSSSAPAVDAYASAMQGCSAVQKGHDFTFNGVKYQVKGNRLSGKPGSAVSWVPKASNYDWDYLIWILYDSRFEIQEAWEWHVADYRSAFDSVKRLSPAHMRRGKRLA